MESIPIHFEPHFHTLTDSGRSHFLRPVDALAEFIDNSIQACRGVTPERHIDISLFLGAESFLMIADNGCGLNVAEVEAFATFSLDQKTRGALPVENDSSFISKFGVGSKQAGFFLGDRITLISKKANENKFLKFSLDYRNFKEKFEAKESVYTDTVTKFPIHDRNFFQSSRDFEKYHSGLFDHILLHQEKYPEHYAIFIIHLRPEMIHKLLEKGRFQMRTMIARTNPGQQQNAQNIVHDLVKEIGEIYYFHLHPEHSMEKLETLFAAKNPGKTMKNTSSREERLAARSSQLEGFNKSSASSDRMMVVESPLIISYAEYDNHVNKYFQIINESNNLISDCIKAAKNIFPFELQVPDFAPTYSTITGSSIAAATEKKKGLTQQTQSAERETAMLPVSGFLLYFPVANGTESIPTAFANAFSTEEDVIDLTGTSSRTNQSCFKVFWQNRLVPEALLQRLNFFPKTDTMKMDEFVEKNWRQRIIGFLFLDWHFHYISNNKLKICLEPEMWINHKKCEEISPVNAAKKFKDWLKNCYKSFDKEYIFHNRTEDFRGKSRFNNCILRIQDEEMHEITAGEMIKWKVNNCLFIGEILYFEIAKSLPKVELSFSGMGEVIFKRLPIETYGANAVQSMTLENIDPDNVRPSKAEINSIERITSARIFLFPSENPSIREEIKNGDEIVVGVKYAKIGIQLFNQFDLPMIGLPNIPKDSADRKQSKYFVSLEYDGYDFKGPTADLFEFDEETKKEKKYSGSTPINAMTPDSPQLKELLKYYYSFYDVKFNKIGEFDLSLTVRLPDKDKTIIFQENFALSFINAKVSQVEIDFHLPNNHYVFTLGEPLPSFTLYFFDALKKPIQYSGNIKILMESKDMLISRNEKNASFSLIEVDNQDHFIVETLNIWKPIPMNRSKNIVHDDDDEEDHDENKNSSILFDAMQYIPQKPISFTCRLLEKVHSSSSTTNKKDKFKELCPEIQFTLLFRPGIPHQLHLWKPESLPIAVENHDSIPFLHFIVRDAWGNRTIIPSDEMIFSSLLSPSSLFVFSFVKDLTKEEISQLVWFIEFQSTGPLELNSSSSSSSSSLVRNAIEFSKGSGELVCSSIKCNYPGSLPMEGKEVNQEILLKTNQNKKSCGGMKDFEVFELPILITPDFVPSEVRIFQDEQEISGQTISTSPGATINNLSFKIYSKDGTLVELAGDLRNCSLECSWQNESAGKGNNKSSKSAKRKKPQLPEDGKLPAIHIPTKNFPASLHCKMDISWNGIPLSEEFYVTVAIAEPTQWKIVFDSLQLQEGIRNQEKDDFITKVFGVCLVDSFDNPLRSKKELWNFTRSLSIAPMLSISQIIEEELTEEAINEMNNDQTNAFPIEFNEEEEIFIRKFFEIPLVPGKIHPEAIYLDDNSLFTSLATAEGGGEDEEDDTNLLGFLIPSDWKSRLSFSLPIGTKLFIEAKDAGDAFRSSAISSKIIAGFPKSVSLSCASLSQEDPVNTLRCTISRYTKIKDIKVFLFDAENAAVGSSSSSTKRGNLAEIGAHLKHLTLEIFDITRRRRRSNNKKKPPNRTKLMTKKNITTPEITIATFKYDFIQALEEAANEDSDGEEEEEEEEEVDIFSTQPKQKKPRKSDETLPMEVETCDLDLQDDDNDQECIENGVFKFEFLISYEQSNGQRINLSPAEFIITIEELNLVTEMSLQLAEKNEKFIKKSVLSRQKKKKEEFPFGMEGEIGAGSGAGLRDDDDSDNSDEGEIGGKGRGNNSDGEEEVEGAEGLRKEYKKLLSQHHPSKYSKKNKKSDRGSSNKSQAISQEDGAGEGQSNPFDHSKKYFKQKSPGKYQLKLKLDEMIKLPSFQLQLLTENHQSFQPDFSSFEMKISRMIFNNSKKNKKENILFEEIFENQLLPDPSHSFSGGCCLLMIPREDIWRSSSFSSALLSSSKEIEDIESNDDEEEEVNKKKIVSLSAPSPAKKTNNSSSAAGNNTKETNRFLVPSTIEMKITYEEKRPFLTSILPTDCKKKKIELTIHLKEGKPCRMILTEQSRLQLQSSAVIVNSKNPDHRLIGKDILVQLLDSAGNICSFHDYYEVTCEVIHSSSLSTSPSSSSLQSCPRLESDFPEGIVLGDISSSAKDKPLECYFPSLRVEFNERFQANNSNNNRYQLLFSLYDKRRSSFTSSSSMSSPPSPLLRAALSFKITNNDHLFAQKKQLQQSLEPLLKEYKDYQELFAEWKSIHQELEGMKDLLTKSIQLVEDDVEGLKDLQRTRENEMDYMRSRVTQVRILKKKANFPDPIRINQALREYQSSAHASRSKNSSSSSGNNDGMLGLMVDLCYVNNLREAKIISWASQECIDALVVEQSALATQLYRNGIKALPLDQIIPFQFQDSQGTRRRRNKAEIESGQLPFPPIVMTDEHGKKITPPGNPRYLVNLVQLNRDQEYLRDTLLYNNFQRSLLFDDLETAMAYRAYLVRINISPPLIFTMEGERISARAVLNPSPSGKCPADMDFIFGELSTSEGMSAMHTIEREMEIVSRRLELLEKKNSLSRRLGRYEGIEEKIKQIRSELDKL